MFRIENPVQAKAICDVDFIEDLMTFIGEAKSVSQVAKEWNVTPNAAFYRVSKLEKLGLIHIAKSLRRAGKNQKYYQAIAERFFVPVGIVPEATLEFFLAHTNQHHGEKMLKAQEKALHEYLLTSGEQWGIQIGRKNKYGQKYINISNQLGQAPDITDEQFPMLISTWSTLNLNYADALEFRQEITDVFKKFMAKSGSNKYLMRFALAPIE